MFPFFFYILFLITGDVCMWHAYFYDCLYFYMYSMRNKNESSVQPFVNHPNVVPLVFKNDFSF